MQQVRKASLSEVLRVADLKDLIDVTGIQVYRHDDIRVVHLKQRYTQGGLKRGTKMFKRGFACLVCKRRLMDDASFCSVECKVLGTLYFILCMQRSCQKKVWYTPYAHMTVPRLPALRYNTNLAASQSVLKRVLGAVPCTVSSSTLGEQRSQCHPGGHLNWKRQRSVATHTRSSQSCHPSAKADARAGRYVHRSNELCWICACGEQRTTHTKKNQTMGVCAYNLYGLSIYVARYTEHWPCSDCILFATPYLICPSAIDEACLLVGWVRGKGVAKKKRKKAIMRIEVLWQLGGMQAVI